MKFGMGGEIGVIRLVVPAILLFMLPQCASAPPLSPQAVGVKIVNADAKTTTHLHTHCRFVAEEKSISITPYFERLIPTLKMHSVELGANWVQTEARGRFSAEGVRFWSCPNEIQENFNDTVILKNGRVIENVKAAITKNSVVIVDQEGKTTVLPKKEIRSLKIGSQKR